MTLADLPVIVEAGFDYARYRLRRPNRAVHSLIRAPGGRTQLSDAERLLVRKADLGLQRLGVRCLGRAVVTARMLSRRHVAASISLSVAAADPRSAHAELAVGGRALRPHPEGHVLFR